MARMKACTSPITAKSVTPIPPEELIDTIAQMKKTSRNVPMNSATYAGHSRSSTADPFSVGGLRAAAILCRRPIGGLSRADVERPAGLALAAHVPANVDAGRRARLEMDHARHAPALRTPVVGPGARVVEVLVDD